MFRFHNFEIYKKSRVLHRAIVELTKEIPNKHYYLKDQILRASLSINLNIAEGAGRRSDREFNRFLMISLGSLYEVVACLDVCFDMRIINNDAYQGMLSEHSDLRNLIGGFSKTLKS